MNVQEILDTLSSSDIVEMIAVNGISPGAGKTSAAGNRIAEGRIRPTHQRGIGLRLQTLFLSRPKRRTNGAKMGQCAPLA